MVAFIFISNYMVVFIFLSNHMVVFISLVKKNKTLVAITVDI